jgi:hypothetical protein|tara:strand:+ start:2128 stop:2730 length:603 start_codon:yes stop_codon:yes gene_type:complete
MALRDRFLEEIDIETPVAGSMAPTPGAAPPALPEAELAAANVEADQAAAAAFAAANPVGDFSMKEINTLIDSVNDILPLFDPEAPLVPAVEADLEEFPTELTTAISMIIQAGSDAGLDPEDVPALEALVDDRAMIETAGILDALIGNSIFKSFLKQVSGAAPPEEVAIEEVVETPGAPPAELEELFKTRVQGNPHSSYKR